MELINLGLFDTIYIINNIERHEQIITVVVDNERHWKVRGRGENQIEMHNINWAKEFELTLSWSHRRSGGKIRMGTLTQLCTSVTAVR